MRLVAAVWVGIKSSVCLAVIAEVLKALAGLAVRFLALATISLAEVVTVCMRPGFPWDGDLGASRVIRLAFHPGDGGKFPSI